MFKYFTAMTNPFVYISMTTHFNVSFHIFKMVWYATRENGLGFVIGNALQALSTAVKVVRNRQLGLGSGFKDHAGDKGTYATSGVILD